jgi:hypothetical protein
MSAEYDLIQPGITHPGGRWAVFSGDDGAFALALQEIAGPAVELFLVARDQHILEKQRRAFAKRSPASSVHFARGDCTQRLELRELDGILVADVLHSIPLERHQQAIALLVSYLRSGGSFLFVERERRRASFLVPHPVDYESFEFLAGAVGLRDLRRIAIVPTGLWSAMYTGFGVRP